MKMLKKYQSPRPWDGQGVPLQVLQRVSMGPRHGVDTVELNKAKPIDQCQKIIAMGRALRSLGQCVPIHKYPPCGPVAEGKWRHAPRLRRNVSP